MHLSLTELTCRGVYPEISPVAIGQFPDQHIYYAVPAVLPAGAEKASAIPAAHQFGGLANGHDVGHAFAAAILRGNHPARLDALGAGSAAEPRHRHRADGDKGGKEEGFGPHDRDFYLCRRERGLNRVLSRGESSAGGARRHVVPLGPFLDKLPDIFVHGLRQHHHQPHNLIASPANTLAFEAQQFS